MQRSKQQLFICMALALLLRIFFVQTYYGWEESDYGNLAMVYGVWDSGFTHYDMNHMPGYYFVGALFYALIRSSIWAGIGVSVLSGMGSLYLVYRFASRWSTPSAAMLVFIGLLLQPEFSLYSSSSLREPSRVRISLFCGCTFTSISPGSQFRNTTKAGKRFEGI